MQPIICVRKTLSGLPARPTSTDAVIVRPPCRDGIVGWRCSDFVSLCFSYRIIQCHITQQVYLAIARIKQSETTEAGSSAPSVLNRTPSDELKAKLKPVASWLVLRRSSRCPGLRKPEIDFRRTKHQSFVCSLVQLYRSTEALICSYHYYSTTPNR